MEPQTLLRRTGLILVLLPTFVLGSSEWQHQVRMKVVGLRAANLYDSLTARHTQYQVEEGFGSRGEPISGRHWPHELGELPGYETKASSRTPVWWRIWPVAGEHQWIAVCFIKDGSGGSCGEPRVIAKRSGKRG